MIDVRDLAIGNWVYDGERTQFPMWVQTIGEDYVYLNFEGNEADPWESTPEELHGIPLTEELLEKLGFMYSDKDSIWTSVFTSKIRVDENRTIRILYAPKVGSVTLADRFEVDKGHSVRYEHSTIKVYYLHELQNFVFMTTKQQLKIEL